MLSTRRRAFGVDARWRRETTPVGIAPATFHVLPARLQRRRWRCCRRRRRTASCRRARTRRRSAGCRASPSGKVGIFTSVRASVAVSSKRDRIRVAVGRPPAVFSSGLSARADGASPTATSRAASVSGSTTLSGAGGRGAGHGVGHDRRCRWRAPSCRSSSAAGRRGCVTKILPRSFATATPNGAMPTSTSRVILRVSVSITASVLLRLNAT